MIFSRSSRTSTDDRTAILMSFPMVNHGGHFAQWLRMRLMQRFGFSGTNSVYCDVVSSRADGHTFHLNPNRRAMYPAEGDATSAHIFWQQVHAAQVGALQAQGLTVVSPDYRPHMMKSGAVSIGAMRRDWDTRFNKAMREAKVVLFVLNADYANSQWCVQEWDGFHAERARRRGAGQSPPWGVVLRFNGYAAPAGMDYSGMTVLTVNRSGGGGQVLGRPTNSGNADHDAYCLNETDFAALTAVIAPNL